MAHPIHQSIPKGGLRPFLKWARFLVYIILILVLYQTVITLKPSQTTFDNSSDTKTIEHQKVGQQDDQSIKSFTPLYRDFPWYKEIHPRVIMTANISTAHLTTPERIQLLQSKVAQAKQQARHAFTKLPSSSSSSPIPGSSLIQTMQAAQTLRATIDCWTQGQWVPSSTDRSQLIRHVQDPLYGTCDKRFYKTHAPSVPRPETQYRWQSSGSQCEGKVLPKPTPQQWCRVLNGRHILLVGDLVQYQLHELFLDSLREGPTVCFGELNCKGKTHTHT